MEKGYMHRTSMQLAGLHALHTQVGFAQAAYE
jgi:hypothetical protein